MKRALASLVFLILVVSACSSGPSEEQELTVFAAASLTEAFGEIGRRFEQEHPGVTVTFNFDASDSLTTSILSGGAADVFASASSRWMEEVASDPGVRHETVFARNRLVVIVPISNPAGIDELRDLADRGVKLVLAAEGVPAGDYARDVLAAAGIGEAAEANVVSNEQDVKGVVQKVLLGEADAGIVYATDLTDEVVGRVHAVEIPEALNVIATYPIAVLEGAEHPDLAETFIRYLLGPGQAVLASHGFLPPD
ncbi:MAG: molybdate ABC transporter substrate-binding protein [Actinomycetota bacterium]